MRRFNYTGRIKLKRDKTLFFLLPSEDGNVQFEARLDLADFRTDHPNARVAIEAYVGSRTERFELGTVSGPDLSRRRLANFRADDPVLFRVKVIDETNDAGRLLGLAKQIRPKGPDDINYSSLLPVTVGALENLVYRVDFSPDSSPTLVLNEQLDQVAPEGIKAIARSHPMFVALVFPAVLREILTHLLLVDEIRPDDEDMDSWKRKWIDFARLLNPSEFPQRDDPDGVLNWIESGVTEFARKTASLPRFEQALRDQS